MSTPLDAQLEAKRGALLAYIARLDSCAVAFSAGVDSTVVAKAAQLALGDAAIAVTADSPSVPAGEVEMAAELAARIGIEHRVIHTDEFENPNYVQNASDRCYHCKTELYSQLEKLAPELGFKNLLNGANLDDRGDYRPGMTAAHEHQVLSPLIECGITKQDARGLAAHWELPVWDKPASPCLSSRVAYGEQVTPERLAMIDAAEQFFREHGFREVRVRYHRDNLARIEVPADMLARLTEPTFRTAVTARMRELGFRYLTLDLEGFRSGSMNELLTIQPLQSHR